MKKKQGDNPPLSAEILKGASDYIKQKAFRKNSPIVIMENGKIYHLDKNNKKTEVKTGNSDKNK